MADERDLNGLEPGNGPVDDWPASGADDAADGALARGPAAGPSSDGPAADGSAPEGVSEEPPAGQPDDREEPDEPPTDWSYSSSGSGGSGEAGGSGGTGGAGGTGDHGHHMKDGGGNGGGRKRNRGIIIAIVVVLVVAVVGLVAAIVELTKCDHEWAEATCTEPATCTKCGKTDGEALGHDWQEATCTEPETCSRCGETEGEALGHEWEDATCTEPETCSVCGETQGDPLGHDVEEWTVTLEPTCAVEGEQTGTCTVCGEVVTEAIDTTDEHTEGEWSFTSSIGVKQLLCAVCGEVMESETAEVYNEDQYVVGEDLPAGEYKLYAYTSSEFGASVNVFPDSSSVGAADQLIIASFDDCFYISVTDGQYVKVRDAVIVPVEEAEPTALTETVSAGMYKVGYDIEPGEYRVSFTSDSNVTYSYAISLSSSDVTSNSDGSAWVDDVWYSDTDGEDSTITVSEGQYLELYGVTVELVD